MTAVLDQAHELTWGGVVFASDTEPDTPYRFEALVGTAYGNPVPLTEVVRSYLTDGELIKRTGWGNREDVPVYVRVSAPDGQALALGEAALAQEYMADAPAPLRWVPPTLGAWPMAFDVVHVVLERDWKVDLGDSWDHRERFDHTIVYKLAFTTLPFTRDWDTTIIPALEVPADPDEPVLIGIDSCDSTAGWERYASPSTGWNALTGPIVVDGSVRVSAGVPSTGSWPWVSSLSLERTGPVSMDDTPYLQLVVFVADDGTIPLKPNVSVQYSGSGQNVYPVAVQRNGGSAHSFTMWFSAPSSFNRLRINARFTSTSDAFKYLYVYDVSRTDRVGIDGTNGLQVARTAVIGGTAPTQAAIRLASNDTGPLVGSTALFYTGTSPVVSLRARSSNSDALGNRVVDPTKMSGATNDLSVAMKFWIPVPMLTRAKYSFLARMAFTGTKTVSWSAKLVDAAGEDIPGSDLVVSGVALLRNPTTDPWRIHHIATQTLPPLSTSGVDTDQVQITLTAAPGTGDGITFDEGWLANTDDGAITLIHEPSSHDLTAVELRSAQLDAPFPSVYGTWSSGRTQDITRLTRIGSHKFKPGLLHIFTATDMARYAGCELEYFRRYFLLAGPDLPTEVPA